VCQCGSVAVPNAASRHDAHIRCFSSSTLHSTFRSHTSSLTPHCSLPRCRCTSLQELRVTTCCGPHATALGFKGQGSIAAQRCLSLQQDLALATLTAPSMFHHSVWRQLPCLTSLRLQAPSPFHGPQQDAPEDSEHAPHSHALSDAVNTTSLVRLDIWGLASAGDFPLLAHLSNLRSLTHLTIRPGFWQPHYSTILQNGLVQLSRLQSLFLTGPFSGGGNLSPLRLALPMSRLASLTAVRLNCFTLDPMRPVVLGAVRDLELCKCRLDSLRALSACAQLTRLEHRFAHQHQGGGHDTLVDLPAQWREGLRSLAWWPPCDAGTIGWVEELRRLTSLSLQAVSMTPAFFR
jgi:hypothetical protein